MMDECEQLANDGLRTLGIYNNFKFLQKKLFLMKFIKIGKICICRHNNKLWIEKMLFRKQFAY